LSNRPLALVTGATGALGPALVRELDRAGYRVRAMARRPPASGLFPPGTMILTGDVRDPAAVREAVRDVHVVFHLASVLHRRVVDPASVREYDSVNVVGTRTVAAVAARVGVRRFVHFSTINVYGPTRPGEMHTEASPPRPDSEYGRSKLAAESEVLNGPAPAAVVLRCAAVYGPRVQANYASLVRALRRRVFVPIGNGRNRRTLIHEDDAARGAVQAAERTDATGIYNLTDGEVHTLDAIIAAICEALGRRTPRLCVPAAAARGIAAVAARVPGSGPRGDAVDAMVSKLLEDFAVDGSRIQRELGFLPAIALRDGWADAVAAMKHDG
jgi:nucleoside-diphosphate-sugar epimerase